MKQNWIGLLTALSVFAFVPSGTSASTLESAEDFLETIYDPYVGPEGEAMGVDLDETTVLTLFEPDLAEMIMLDRLEAGCVDEPPRLNGDPFVGRQDWIIDGYAIAMMPNNQAGDDIRILARLDFDTPYPSEAVRLHLVWMDASWRISEIEWDDATLRGILSEN
jgi:hypothetical protein